MEINWTDVRAELRRLLLVYAGRLTQETVDAVEHYVEHDEYEIALEGLCLELMDLSEFTSEDREICKRLSMQLGLNRESVFDPGFWRKLNQESPSS